jgi:hypothetical protein
VEARAVVTNWAGQVHFSKWVLSLAGGQILGSRQPLPWGCLTLARDLPRIHNLQVVSAIVVFDGCHPWAVASDLELPLVVSRSDTGSIPLFLIVASASGEAKNRRNCFATAGCFEWTATPPEYNVIF